ncbi:unnamed protein product [Ranitomeya imitator]|uniref:Reverse transcriptase RNase H-like domain-containing protein n=1 Tax=Ranitomeya imitator TaxID=111125 RepID=A0ABN9MI39_9NEOB|nr:unnamed protein product [Ranitomeya imitator]
MCAFFSRKFSPAERQIMMLAIESAVLAMKWAFEEWRHWLEGAKHRVVVLTDHKNLTYLESAKRVTSQISMLESASWGCETISDFWT